MAQICVKHRMPGGAIMDGPPHGPDQHCIEWKESTSINMNHSTYRNGGTIHGRTSKDNNHTHSYNVDSMGNGETFVENDHSHRIINNTILQNCTGGDCHMHMLNRVVRFNTNIQMQRGGRTRPQPIRKFQQGGHSHGVPDTSHNHAVQGHSHTVGNQTTSTAYPYTANSAVSLNDTWEGAPIVNIGNGGHRHHSMGILPYPGGETTGSFAPGPGGVGMRRNARRSGGRVNPKFSDGGMLIGPSHEEGGIDALVDGTEPIEVEGGEFVINKKTVDAVGEDFLHKLNSTATPYHPASQGFQEGQLPSPSNYEDGGHIKKDKQNRNKMRVGGSSNKKYRKNLKQQKKFRTGGRMMKSPECRMHNGKIGCNNQKGCSWNYQTLMCHG